MIVSSFRQEKKAKFCQICVGSTANMGDVFKIFSVKKVSDILTLDDPKKVFVGVYERKINFVFGSWIFLRKPPMTFLRRKSNQHASSFLFHFLRVAKLV